MKVFCIALPVSSFIPLFCIATRVLLILLFLLCQFYFLYNILARYLESQASNGGFYLKWFYVSYPDIIVQWCLPLCFEQRHI